MATIFRTASLWLKVAMAAMALGLLLFIIGFATNSWMIGPFHRCGLWEIDACSERGRKRCSTHDVGDFRNSPNDYHRAIQAMECLGLIGFVLATVILLLYMVMDSARRRDFLQAATAMTFAGLLFAIIGFAIYGSSSNTDNMWGLGKDVGWSMGIACAGSAFYGLAGIMLIIQLIK